jgi:hypothetical protein
MIKGNFLAPKDVLLFRTFHRREDTPLVRITHSRLEKVLVSVILHSLLCGTFHGLGSINFHLRFYHSFTSVHALSEIPLCLVSGA